MTLEALLASYLERWQRARQYAEWRAVYRAVTGLDPDIEPYTVQILDRSLDGKMTSRFEERVWMRSAADWETRRIPFL